MGKIEQFQSIPESVQQFQSIPESVLGFEPTQSSEEFEPTQSSEEFEPTQSSEEFEPPKRVDPQTLEKLVGVAVDNVYDDDGCKHPENDPDPEDYSDC